MKKDKEVSVQLVLKNENLHFKADKVMNVAIQAQCKNIDELDGIQYKWYLYRDGLEKCVKTTSTGAVVVSIHPMYAGSRFRVKLVMTAHGRLSTLGEDSLYIGRQNTEFAPFYSSTHIEFTPTCEEKVVSVDWCDKNTVPFYRKKMKDGAKSDNRQEPFPLQGERFGAVFCIVDLMGYNGQEVVIHREVLGMDEEYTKLINKSMVQPVIGGRVGASFGRNLLKLGLKSGESREVTAIMRIQESETSTGILGDFRCKLKVEGNDKVDTMESCPIQPVMVGDYNVMENNYEPCKYTQIIVEYTSEKAPQQKVIYNEVRMLKAIPVYIIGGKSKTTVTLKDYTTQKCSRSSDEHTKAIFDNAKPPLNIKNGKIELDLKYDYGKDLDDSNLIKAWENDDYLAVLKEAANFKGILKLFDYFLLPFGVVQSHTLQVATCRHNHILELNMIPDIIWTLHVGFGKSYPDYNKVKMPVYNPQKSIRDQMKAAAEVRDNQLQGLAFEVGLIAEYNGGQKIDMKNTFIKQVEDASQKVEKVVKWFQLDKFFKFKDKAAQKEFNERVKSDNEAIQYSRRKPTSSKYRPAKLPIPINMKIQSPMLFIGGTWQYDVNSNNKLSRKGTIKLEADPLLGVELKLDLIACSQYILAVGQVISAIIKGKEALEKLVHIASDGKVEVSLDLEFNIYVKGAIKLKGDLAISDDDKTIALEVVGNLKFGVELSIQCAMEAKTVTITNNGKETTILSGELGIGGTVESSFTLTPTLGYSTSKGILVEVELKFDGVTIEINGKAKIEKLYKNEEIVKKKKGKKVTEKERDGWSNEAEFKKTIPLVKDLSLGKLEFIFQNNKKPNENNI